MTSRIVGRGAGTGLSGGALAQARRNCRGLLAHEPHLGDGRGKSAGRGRTRSRESRSIARGRKVRLVLRSRSVQPESPAPSAAMSRKIPAGRTRLRTASRRTTSPASNWSCPTAKFVQIGGRTMETPGYDLTGLVIGSEGTFALVTEITVRLLRLPEDVRTLLAIYDSLEDATDSVVDITARGIIPAACEMLDGWTLRAVEAYVHAGFPLDSAAVLLIEVEGVRESAEAQAAEITEVCRAHHAREVRRARDARERALLWKGRKEAFGAVGRVSPSYYVLDGVIPAHQTHAHAAAHRRNLQDVTGCVIGNIFHAGDGNLHPLILFDHRDPDQFRRARAAGAEIMQLCVEMGGTLTGEHGVGMEKNELMPLMFTEADLELMRERPRGIQSRRTAQSR